MGLNRLSHSAITVFQECGQKFFNHYRLKIRSETTNSALLFGSAVDKSLELALKQFPNCNENDIKYEFLKHWNHAELNGQVINIATSELIKYSKADAELDENQWLSLAKKGSLIIEAFFREVFPNIEEVIAIQKEISLVNSNGDSVVGFADAILKWKGYKQPIIFDFKTSARKYDKNAVKESPQLTLYKHALSEEYKTITGGFIVFIKTINKNASKICTKCEHDGSATSHKTCNNTINDKRCQGELLVTLNPKIDVQILIDDIDEEFENKVLNGFDDVNVKLQQEEFAPNWNSCWSKYGKCTYFDYCQNGSMIGLVKVESKNK